MRDSGDSENKNQNPSRDPRAIESTAIGTLVFTIKEGEVVTIGDDVQITMKRMDRKQARMTVKAPKSKKIQRLGFLNPWTNEVMTSEKKG